MTIPQGEEGGICPKCPILDLPLLTLCINIIVIDHAIVSYIVHCVRESKCKHSNAVAGYLLITGQLTVHLSKYSTLGQLTVHSGKYSTIGQLTVHSDKYSTMANTLQLG